FRNLNQVLKINRQTGNIIWKLGGHNSDFAISNNEQFLRQHDVRVTSDKTLIVFDNGESNIRASTRILEFQLDESSKTITNFYSFDVPGTFVQYMGSVRKRTNASTYFIGGGSSKYLLEVNYET